MPARARSGARRTVAGLLGLLLLVLGVQAALPAVASADSAPADPAATPTTVSADGLPTVQINGVVWAQTTVGNTVYATGSFTRARPPGAAAGVNETVRSNLLAFDITTGQLVTTWAPSLNGQGRAIAASPDGSRIYVGGDFTQANGVTRNRVAAFDAVTGALVTTFAPSVNGTVRAVAVSGTSVYLGGSFSAVGNVSRTRLAAVNATNGALLPWAPVPGAGTIRPANDVLALAVTNGNQVAVGGRFVYMSGQFQPSVVGVNASTGAVMPFAINKIISNSGADAATWSLYSDGATIYGTTYHYGGSGDIEGPFIANAAGGTPRWLADCRGDSYSSYPMNGVLYVASHAHNCAQIGGFPEQTDRVWKFGNAYTLAATGKNGTATFGGNLLAGTPAPTMLDWFPTLTQGTVTGQFQAGWSVTGNGTYVSYGGEFPRVNGVGQQGLVRFVVPSLAPNKIGPAAIAAPTVSSLGAGAVRVRWTATSDQDNENLTYRVYRDGNTTTPIYETVKASQWWTLPSIAVADTGLSAGAHTYRVTASDPYGNTVSSAWTSFTVTTGAADRPYADAVRTDGATGYWPMGERSGNAVDYAGLSDMVLSAGVSRGGTGALDGDADTAFSFNGTASATASTQTAAPAPNVFTEEAWFQTSSRTGGRILGYASAKTGNSQNYDRFVYMNPAGNVLFGVYSGGLQQLQSAAAYNDGKWHHVAASLSPQGMALYVDGTLVASRATVTWASGYAGYWRLGSDVHWGSDNWTFSGRIDEAAVYPTALNAAQIANHYSLGASGTATNLPPVAAFTSKATYQDVAFDGTGSTDTDGTVTSYAWTFGDGSTGTGATPSHSYASAGTWTVTLTVTDDDGSTATRTATVTTTTTPANVPPTAAFTATAAGRTVAVDGGGSADSDGTLASYAWTFGDGSTGTGATASHTYAADGSYAVTLTVTDNRGGTSTASRTVQVSGAVIASDAFSRTVAGGLGVAEVGGAWTSSAGPTRQSVTGGTANLALTAGTNTGSYLGTVSTSSADVQLTATLSSLPTGGGTNLYVTGRRVGTNQEYRARLRVLADGRVAVAVTRLAGSATEALVGSEVVVPDLVYTAGTELHVRFVVSGTGTTDLAASVWADGTAEPAVPTVSRTDTTASLQAPGAVGVLGYLSGTATAPVTVAVDDLVVTPAA